MDKYNIPSRQESEQDCDGGGAVPVQLDPAHGPAAPARAQEEGLELAGLHALLPRPGPGGQEGRQDEGDINQEVNIGWSHDSYDMMLLGRSQEEMNFINAGWPPDEIKTVLR